MIVFGAVPQRAEEARPWAQTRTIGPPAGQSDNIGSLEAQIDKVSIGGYEYTAYRVFAYTDDADDLIALREGGAIMLTLITPTMVPLAIEVVEP